MDKNYFSQLRQKYKKKDLPKNPFIKEEEFPIKPPLWLKVINYVFNAFSIFTTTLTAVALGNSFGQEYAIIGSIVIFCLAVLLERQKNENLNKFFNKFLSAKATQGLNDSKSRKIREDFDSSYTLLWPLAMSIICSVLGLFLFTTDNIEASKQDNALELKVQRDSVERMYSKTIDSLDVLTSGDKVIEFVKQYQEDLFSDKDFAEKQLNGAKKLEPSLIREYQKQVSDSKEKIEKAQENRLNELNEKKNALMDERDEKIKEIEALGKKKSKSDHKNYLMTLFTFFIEGVICFLVYQMVSFAINFLKKLEEYEKNIMERSEYTQFENDMKLADFIFSEYTIDDYIVEAKVLQKAQEIYKKKDMDWATIKTRLDSWGIIQELQIPKKKKGRGRQGTITVYKLFRDKKSVEEFLSEKYSKLLEE